MAAITTPAPAARSSFQPTLRTPCSCTALPAQITRCRSHHRVAFFALQAFTSCHAAISTLQIANCPSAISADRIIDLSPSSATEDFVNLVAELMGLGEQAETTSITDASRPLNLAFVAPKKHALRLRDIHEQLRTFLIVRKGLATRRDIGRELALICGIDLDALAQKMYCPEAVLADEFEALNISNSFSCVFTSSKLIDVSDIDTHDDASNHLLDEPMIDTICMSDLILVEE